MEAILKPITDTQRGDGIYLIFSHGESFRAYLRI